MRRVGSGCLPKTARLGIGAARFPRGVRLTGSAQFQRVFKKPRLRYTTAAIAVLAVDNNLGVARLGVAISRKVARRAVTRNRIKRVIRDSFRCQRQSLPSMDIVVVGEPGADKKTNAELRDALQRHWERLSK